MNYKRESCQPFNSCINGVELSAAGIGGCHQSHSRLKSELKAKEESTEYSHSCSSQITAQLSNVVQPAGLNPASRTLNRGLDPACNVCYTVACPLLSLSDQMTHPNSSEVG